jgi:hypothetical protein
MPVIPLPPAANTAQFNRQAGSIPELQGKATPDAFGANVADELYRGNLALGRNIASAAEAEGRMITQTANSVVRLAGEVWQRDQRLEAEARLNDLQLGITRESEAEGNEATGDGSARTRTMATFEDQARRLEEGARTPYQASLYREGVQRLRFQMDRAAIGAEVQAHRAARLENINTIVSAAEVAIFRDAGTLDAQREAVLASINAAPVTPAQRARLLQEAESRLVQVAIERHLNSGNPAGARALLQADRNITALGGLNAARMDARITRAVEEATERARALAHNQALIAGTALVDPANTEHRRLITEAFAQTGGPQQLAAMDANAVTSVSTIATRYGVVPQSAISLLQGMLANGSAQQQIFALNAISTIETARPGVFEHTPLHRTARAEADDFRFLTTGVGGLGLDPAEALRRIQEMRSPEFATRADARRAALGATGGPRSRRTEAELVTLFDDAFWSDPRIGNPRDSGVMLQTYQRAFDHHFLRTGSEEMALSAAQADVRRVYGVTRQSGGEPRVVRRPVELVYPSVAGGHDYVRTQLAALIQAERGITVAPADIFLEANRDTEQAITRGGVAGGHPPPYAFYWRVRDARGERFESIPGRLFVPDLPGARAAATAAAEAERATLAPVPESSASSLTGAVPRAKGPRAVTVGPPRITPPVVPGFEPETLTGAERRMRDRASVLDLLGWGARVTGGGN